MLPWHPPDSWWIIAEGGFNLATVTMPGHERDLGVIERRLLWELEVFAWRATFGRKLSHEEAVGAVLKTARRKGIPAVRGEFDGECIVIRVARPMGEG